MENILQLKNSFIEKCFGFTELIEKLKKGLILR
ncbi:MAG: hypothetical protein ACJAX7_000670 [Saprospiraceae bacterium]|jgi:hypothetical protein